MSSQVKILFVDDEPSILKALRRIFIDEDDYEILCAESGQEGLRILEETDNIHLVIADYRMPRMDGIEFLSQVSERWPGTVRIVLSGYADISVVVEAINLGGIFKFVAKPWKDEELKNEISSALKHQALQMQVMCLNEELHRQNEQLEQTVANRTEALELRNQVLEVSRGVLDVLPVGVFCIDKEGTIVQMNDFALNLCPCGSFIPLGYDCRDVFPDDINDMLDGSGGLEAPGYELTIGGRRFRALVRKIRESHAEGNVLMLIPEP